MGPTLGKLRHCWCWEKRTRLHIPTWSYSKVPSSKWSPEENARLLCIYMRPWTLDPKFASNTNPLLPTLGKCYLIDGKETPDWLTSSSSHNQDESVDQCSSPAHRSSQERSSNTQNTTNIPSALMPQTSSNIHSLSSEQNTS